MEWIKLLYRCLNYFGLGYGLSLFIKISFGKLSKISLPGFKYSIALRNNTTDLDMFYQVFFNQCYNLSLDFEPKVIIDAGANVGLASAYFANKYPESKVIALEPEKNNFHLLQENCKAYNVKPLNQALWNKVTNLLVEDIGLGESGFVVKESSEGGVEGTTIERIMKDYDIDQIDILKVDIEGSELEVFSDNYNWLKRTKVLIVETHDNIRKGSSKPLLSAISSLDFSLSLMGENLCFFNNSLN